jgi:IS30 family transposase
VNTIVLELKWSPEQIAAWLRRTYPDLTGWHVCHAATFQAIYHGGKGGLSRQLTQRRASDDRCAGAADARPNASARIVQPRAAHRSPTGAGAAHTLDRRLGRRPPPSLNRVGVSDRRVPLS